KDAVGPLDHVVDVFEDVFREAQALQLQIDGRAVQHAQHDRLPELRGQRGHAEVDQLVPEVDRDAAVLREAPLGDVQVGHDLDAGNHRQGQVLGRRGHLVKGAIDAVADL